ncbi:dephospho-CoA kinase [Flavobacterium rivuli WB 3.3-2 = DSM 21788]|uniref:Dephospho-CoA kinase n=1 Tax=Flavobacterium rivuli WB 3.3-2 = DSM 21788 TaxID=1121895 RepID=A0A0A2MEL3_9FLAO|nr:dephospho-CoA kinase [Flavobacterium rivuli]KGO86725.1 dephospho-CoA kinase [Flavobacterium rivuli WB 3.3-2 = DSM 21788]
MKPKIIGLTGGIGSGKSTIAGYFAALDIPVYIADDEAKKILFMPHVVKELIAIFGNDILTEGIPDKAKIAALVFNNPEQLAKLNSIIHPKVAEHFKDWVLQNSGKLFVIKETAILFESGSYKDCDFIILVTAPTDVRIQRVMNRDGVTREKVLQRIENQWNDQKTIPLSNFVINNIDLESAKEQVVDINNLLKNVINKG